MKLIVDQRIFETFPEVRIGVVVASGISNRKGDEILKRLREQEVLTQGRFGATTSWAEIPELAAWRKVYKQFGVKNNKYVSSVEALVKRAAKGGSLPNINPLVNLYNALSLTYLLPFGGEDLEAVAGDIRLTFAQGTESGTAIGSDQPESCEPGEVAYLDEKGFLCRKWNWREAEWTKLTETTKRAVLVAEALPPVTDEVLKQASNELAEEIRSQLGGRVTVYWVDEREPVMELR